MAQSKSFFGLRKGSTKSLTFQVLNGKQITKDRVYNVKNPQSLAQMQQRALMATTVTAYSNLKAICDHSFEGVEVGSKTMSEFIKNNIKKLASEVPNVNITSYKGGEYANNPYMISKGTLTPPKTKVEKGKFIIDTGIKAGGTTWKSVAESLGIKKDGMLTFVIMSASGCLWLRIKFNDKLWNAQLLPGESNSSISDLQQLDAVEGNALEFADMFSIPEKTQGNNEIEITLLEGETAGAIISEKTENMWKRSTAYMQGTFDYKYELGFSTYPINTTLLLNGGKMSTNVL